VFLHLVLVPLAVLLVELLLGAVVHVANLDIAARGRLRERPRNRYPKIG
jgi:hypothetical protein